MTPQTKSQLVKSASVRERYEGEDSVDLAELTPEEREALLTELTDPWLMTMAAQAISLGLGPYDAIEWGEAHGLSEDDAAYLGAEVWWLTDR